MNRPMPNVKLLKKTDALALSEVVTLDLEDLPVV